MRYRKGRLSSLFGILMLLVLTACGTVTNAPSQAPPQSASIAEVSSHTESSTTEAVSSTPIVEGNPVIYITTNISPTGLLKIYKSLGRELTGKVAVKISTGEPGSHFLDANLIKHLVQMVDGTIVECNTAYGGNHTSTAYHMQLAADHGYTTIAKVNIMDADGYASIPVTGNTRLTENLVSTNFTNYDSYMILSHFKGHHMGGFGGAIKNMSIGIASADGADLIEHMESRNAIHAIEHPVKIGFSNREYRLVSIYD